MSRGTWLEWYEQGGLEGLLTIKKAPGKKPLASPEVVEALKERLHHPEGFRAYGEIQAYLAQEHRVSMAYSSVHALVRYRLRAKPKSPRRSHPKITLTG
jgi:transposase